MTTSLLILEKNDNRIVSITLFDIFLDTHYVLSLDLIRRRSTCEVAAGTACDTTPTHEVKVPPATRNIAGPEFPAGMPEKLNSSRIRRHAGEKDF